ncbi:NAD(P)-binding protein [Imleria badia]|nr:NAD(P)-binding protein [Imleria badia]
MAPALTSRDEKTCRILPQIVLSEASNPLTRPLTPPPPNLTPVERATWRFTIRGNAIEWLVAARALLEHGAFGVSLWDIHPEISDPAVQELISSFPCAKVVTKARVRDAITQTVFELGSVDVLLCFASVVACTHALELGLHEWKWTLDINTTGSWLCAQAVAKWTGGSIVFTASISAHSVSFLRPQVAYNVSKGALLQLKNSLAAEWARYGIRVNSISPGDIIVDGGGSVF